MIRSFPKRTAILLLSLLLSLLGWAFVSPGGVPIKQSQNNPAIQLAARAGFDNFVRESLWMPVQVEISNSGPDLKGQVQVVLRQMGVTSNTTYAQEIDLPRNAQKRITLYVYLEDDFSQNFEVQFVSGGRVMATKTVKPQKTAAQMYLAGVLAEDGLPFNNMSNSHTILARVDISHIPEQAPGLEALNALVVSNIDTGLLSPAQRSALEGWVNGGGSLLVFGGGDWQRVAAGLDSLLPVEIEGTVTAPDLKALSSLTGGNVGDSALAQSSSIARVRPRAGAQVIVGTGDIPLIVDQAFGAGRVVYLAFDPGQEPFIHWTGKQVFYTQLLARSPVRPGWTWGLQNGSIAEHMAANIAGQKMPPAGLIIGFMLAYVLAAGPLHFFLVRRWKRREMAWLTIPAVVLVFSLGSLGLSVLQHGGRAIINQYMVVQGSTRSAQGRADGIVGVFAPTRSTFNLSVGPQFYLHMFSSNGERSNLPDWQTTQKPGGGASQPRLRVDQAGVQVVAIRGQAPVPRIDPQLSLQRMENRLEVSGQLTNNSAVKLEDAVLLVPGDTMVIGDMAPGTSVNVKAGWQANAISGLMARRESTWAYPTFQGQSFYDLFSPYGPKDAYYAAINAGDPWTRTLSQSTSGMSNEEISLRYEIILALIDGSDFSMRSQPGAIYLAGWSDSAPANVQLSTSLVEHNRKTLYLIQLDYGQDSANQLVVISPDQFNRYSMIDGQVSAADTTPEANQAAATATAAAIAPFPFTTAESLFPGTYRYSYQPIYPIQFRSVENLIFHYELEYMPDMTEMSLWNFSEQTWEEIRVEMMNQDLAITNPQKFVSPEGEIRLEVVVPSGSETLRIIRDGFSLVVQP